MKPGQKTGSSAKKASTTEAPVVCSDNPSNLGNKPRTTYESPSAAVLSKYIDSRMKQFGTR